MDREQFLARTKQKKTVDVELEPGVIVKARKLSALEVEKVRKEYGSPEKVLAGFRYIVSRCLVTESGDRLLTDKDVEAIAEADYDEIERIAIEVMKFSGMKLSDAGDAKNA